MGGALGGALGGVMTSAKREPGLERTSSSFLIIITIFFTHLSAVDRIVPVIS